MNYIRHIENNKTVRYSIDGQNISIPDHIGNKDYDVMKAEEAAGTSTITEQDDTHVPTWEEKRTASIADGGYGTWGEQFEMIGEGTMTAYKTHIAAVKTRHPK